MAKDNYYSQGIYPLRNPQKYKGSMPVVYRSHPEFLMMRKFDITPRILEWASESIVIPYIKPTDGRIHRYFVDFTVKMRENDGSTVIYLVEYKPSKKIQQPTQSSRKNPKTLLYEMEEYAVNCSKWDAARQYATKHNMKFQIVTEKELGNQ